MKTINKRVEFFENKCIGCRSCEIACSYHLKKAFTPFMSSIKVIRDSAKDIVEISVDSRCDACEDEEIPLCVKYCVSDALKLRDACF